jgi:hypothetical protein
MRYGVLIDGPVLEVWQARVLERLAAVTSTECVALLVADVVPGAELATISVSLVRVRTQKYGAVRVLDAPSETLVAAARLDVLIVLTREVVRGAFVAALRYGAWEFRFGDTTRVRDAVLWARHDGKLTLNAGLERMLPDPSEAIPLRAGKFSARLRGAARTIETIAAAWPAQVCVDLANGIGGYVDGPTVAGTPLAARRADARASLRTRLRAVADRFRAKLDENPVRTSAWHVGIVRSTPLQLTSGCRLPTIEWLPLPNDAHSYLADPFPIERDGRHYLLCEEYDYSSGRGAIVVLQRDEDGRWSAPRRVIEWPYHLSYPFVIEQDGRVYCVPESFESRRVVLYVADPFPHVWREEAVLLENFAAVDSTLLRHAGRWWLFCTNYDESDCTSLWIFHSERLRGPYVPHDNNPVKTDVSSSRPAGAFFRDGDALYRPAQDCSDRYGARLVVQRVVTLTTQAYSEEVVAVIEPDRRGPFPSGFHTISGCRDWSVVDGNRVAYNAAAMRSELRRYAAGVSRKLVLPATARLR